MALPYLLLLLFSLLLFGHGGSKWHQAAARTVPVEYLYPPYNLTYFNYIDTNGVFLRSRNATFAAAVYSTSDADDDAQTRFFFSVLHAASRTPVWAATDGATIVQSIILSLTASGLALTDPADLTAPPAWSTPAGLAAPVAAMRLLDTGQLALIDAANATLWSSFDAPTDTLLPSQTLPVGVPLTSTASDRDLSPGAYRLVLTTTDALLQWRTGTTTTNSSDADFVTYWALSSDPASVQQSNQAVHSMKVNATGVYLLADNAIDTVFTLLFADRSSSKLLKVDPSGRLRAFSMAYSPTAARATLPAVWSAPASDCDLPLPCGSLGLCTPAGNNASSCMCPDAFSTHTTGGCAPADGSALPVPAQACNSTSAGEKTDYGYMSLGDGVGYLGSRFAAPSTAGDALPACRDLCTANCSCLGFLYKNSSRSCFLLHHQIGSVVRSSTTTDAGTAGFIKTLPPPSSSRGGSSSSGLSSITIVFGIVLPTMAAVFITFLLYVLAVQWLRNRRGPDGGDKKKKKHAHGHGNGHGSSSWFMLKMMSSSRASSNAPSEKGDDEQEEDDDEVLIPGLPARFTFADLEAATAGFRSMVGSGGFGSVYRGELPDRTTVAVKRMNSLGTQGRREFLTEIAVIGNVHHVNLVKLRGFCADQSRQLMLVYEFMSRGSLDHSLFLSRRSAGGNNKTPPVLLEWPERVGVCVGAARGLAYLHAGCDRKILHCDVKPENILLDERGGVKIADFGLAKLLSPEQSGLFTTMRGTRGYLAPEWLTNAPVSDKADVYSFGMVLLEIVRGAKNSKLLLQQQMDEEPAPDTNNSGSVISGAGSNASSSGSSTGSSSYFPAVALEAHEEGKRRYAELVDPRLEGRADAAEVARVVRVALCCLHEDASLRPAMTAVAAMLDGSMEVCEPRTEQLAYLRMYGRGIVGGGGGVKWKGSSDITTGGGASSSWSPPSCVSAQQLSAPR